MENTVSIPIETELIDAIDKHIEKEGGTFEDWLVISLIRFFLLSKAYSIAFSAYLKAEFTTFTIREIAEKDILEALQKLDN